MVEVTDQAGTLATQICGCADIRQHKADIAAILAYRAQIEAATRAKVIEECARVAEEWFPAGTEGHRNYGVVASIRKLGEQP